MVHTLLSLINSNMNLKHFIIIQLNPFILNNQYINLKLQYFKDFFLNILHMLILLNQDEQLHKDHLQNLIKFY